MDNSGTILICSHGLELAQMFWYQRAQLRVLRVLRICDMVRSHTCLWPRDHHPALPQKAKKKKTKSETKGIQTAKQHPHWVIYSPFFVCPDSLIAEESRTIRWRGRHITHSDIPLRPLIRQYKFNISRRLLAGD
jgi:hypothetical protein